MYLRARSISIYHKVHFQIVCQQDTLLLEWTTKTKQKEEEKISTCKLKQIVSLLVHMKGHASMHIEVLLQVV
jgi:hypothetical protein